MAELLEVEPSKVLRCALHGTVSKCPLRFVECDEPFTAADKAESNGLRVIEFMRRCEERRRTQGLEAA